MISLNDVLLAMSNIPVDDPIAEIWGHGLQGGDRITEYTGSLPVTITANGDALIDYRIYGADGGVGVATVSGEPAGYKLSMTVGDGNTAQTVPVYIGENQLGEDEYVSYGEQKIYKHTDNSCPPQDSGAWNAGYVNSTGGISAATSAKEIYSDYIAVSSDQTYNFKNFNSFPVGNAGNWYAVGIYDANKNFISRPASPQYGSNDNLKYHLPSNAAYVRLTFRTYDTIDNQLSFTLGDIPPTQFVPYIMPTNPPVPLPEIPTIDGTTVIDYDGDPKPSQMYVKYKDKSGGA